MRRSWIGELALFSGVLLAASFSANAQAVCPIVTVKVSSFSGRVVENTPSAAPWQNLVIELKRRDDEQTLISTRTVDQNGRFAIGQLKKGRYLVDLIHEYISYRLVVKVTESNSLKLKPSILVRLGLDCWNTDVTTVQ